MRKTPAAKVSPATRRCFMAWEDTSITTWVHPWATISLSNWWRSRGSGVVLGQSAHFSRPMYAPMVPIIPTVCPAARRMSRTMWAVVVLPLVPVMPMRARLLAGWP